MAPRVDKELDRLFTLPLDEFTSARNDLARRLKGDGDADAAAEVRALTKPSVAVWAINQTARREAGAVRDLLAAGAALRKAQERALRNGRSDDLRAAQTAEREAVLDVVQRARSVLADADRPASAATLERIARTLGAAAVDDELRPVLKAGRLTEELEPSGFAGLAGLAPAAAPRRVAAGDELAERRRQKEERRARARDLRGRVRELEQRAREAEHEAEAAETAAGKAREAADAARAEADEAAAELAELENV